MKLPSVTHFIKSYKYFLTFVLFSFFASNAMAQRSTCPIGEVANLGFQVLLISRNGDLRRISVPRRSIEVDRRFGELFFELDIQPILRQPAFRGGLVRFRVSTNKRLSTERDIFFSWSVLENELIAVAPNIDDFFPSLAVIDENNAVFTQGDRLRGALRLDRGQRNRASTLFFNAFCDDEIF